MTTRTSRIDVRFIIGVALVLASIAGVWFVVSISKTTTQVYVANGVLLPGEQLTAANVRTIDVALGPATDTYLDAGELPEGMAITRTLTDGELIPRAALTDQVSLEATRVVIETAGAIPAGIAKGSTVTLWVTPAVDGDEAPEPRILVADAVVVTVTVAESMVQAKTSLELIVPQQAIAGVLAAIAGEGSFWVVPAGGAS